MAPQKSQPAGANEVELIKARYSKRQAFSEQKYSMSNPAVYLGEQEKERAFLRWMKHAGFSPARIQDLKVLEIGCGSGHNLLELIRLGFRPENLTGNELLEDRAAFAGERLPSTTKIIVGDASKLGLENGSFDVVLQSTVFTSILDQTFQKILADRAWALVKPGGGVLWYDFIYDNPRNRDVKGVPIRRIRELFPYGRMKVWRITLAPPISRLVTRIHPNLYAVFNWFPFLRSHVFCWIKK